jgi:hypothetical protein
MMQQFNNAKTLKTLNFSHSSSSSPARSHMLSANCLTRSCNDITFVVQSLLCAHSSSYESYNTQYACNIKITHQWVGISLQFQIKTTCNWYHKIAGLEIICTPPTKTNIWEIKQFVQNSIYKQGNNEYTDWKTRLGYHIEVGWHFFFSTAEFIE